MSHGLLLWLENIDRRRNEVVPIPPELDRETLRAHHKTLTVRLRYSFDITHRIARTNAEHTVAFNFPAANQARAARLAAEGVVPAGAVGSAARHH